MLDKMIILGYALFLIVGGFFGWKAGSKVSLIAGSISGVLTLVSFFILSSGNTKPAFYMFLAISILLTISFLMRFLKTQAFMPSGMMLLVSVLAVTFAVIRLTQLK